MNLWNAYMTKLILTPVTKNFEVWTNLWMLATLASQIPILSFGFASAWIGIFLIHSLRSFIRKILSISSQFFVTGVKNWYFHLQYYGKIWPHFQYSFCSTDWQHFNPISGGHGSNWPVTLNLCRGWLTLTGKIGQTDTLECWDSDVNWCLTIKIDQNIWLQAFNS